MNFFKGNLPFVVTFRAIHRHHGIEGSASSETQFGSIFNGLAKVFIAIHEQISSYFGLSGCKVKRKAVGFCIPVGAAAVFFARKAFWAYVEALIFTCIRLVQLKNVESYALLGRNVTFYAHIRFCPLSFPCFSLLCEHLVKAFVESLLDNLLASIQQLRRQVVTRGHVGSILVDDYLIACFYADFCGATGIFLALYALTFDVQLFPIVYNAKLHAGAYLKSCLFGLCDYIGRAAASPGVNFLPEFFFPVGILVFDVSINVRADE